MKPNKTPFVLRIIAALCCFSFGLGQHASHALPTCIQSCCEPVYAWNPGDGFAYSAQIAGITDPFAVGANTTTAWKYIYVQVTTPGSCNAAISGNKFDIWKWKTWNNCCQNPDGTIPTRQQATPTDSKPVLFQAGASQIICQDPE